MLRHLKCAGGIVITASHNPTPYNGVKLLLDNGIAPPKPMAEKIRNMYLQKDLDIVGDADRGQLCYDDRTDDVHLEKVLAIIDADSIAVRNYKVVLDSVNGAGGRIGVKLLARLGCEIIEMNTETTGIFAHTPEPTKENLTTLCDKVNECGADIGFAQDPDADRVAIVDENGRYIGEEYSLGLCAKYIYSKEEFKNGKSAANLSTSRMIDDVAGAAGGEVIRTAVGEANVAEAMVYNNCVIGGEGNGGVIDLRVGPIRDSLVGMAMVLQLMCDEDKSVGEIVDGMGEYCMEKVKFEADKSLAVKIIDAAKEKFADAKIDETDGCRFDFDDGWLHLRTSNTEPVMRSISEAADYKTTAKYIKIVDEIRKSIS
jgi:phosphomannomutase